MRDGEALGRYQLAVKRSASRRLTEPYPVGLPVDVAVAVLELLGGDLLHAPRRVGKPLTDELDGVWSARRGDYRVLYEIDDDRRVVTVLDIDHRRDAYRRR
ncbi:MAG TPA: type II toxin-antitoxin system RelE/ParE family toxin [Frankiaceae bacterium]|nr:type II toxin-antitoxin system RelE/ParE family toxin [Frankiaceae bacterium]